MKTEILESNCKKNYSIEFLRILFAVLIVYFHMIHANIQSFVNWADYSTRFTNCYHCILFVDAFCIIAGFFLYNTAMRSSGVSFLRFGVRKFFRLWPVFAFSVLCTLVLGQFGWAFVQNGFQVFLNLMFMQCNGLSPDNYCNGITWFVSPFFFGLLFYFGLIKNVRPNVRNFIIGLIVYFCYVIFVHSGLDIQTVWGAKTSSSWLNFGMVRICAGLGAGYLTAVLYHNVKNLPLFTDKKYKTRNFVIFTALESILLGIIIYWTLFAHMTYPNMFVFIPMFVMLVLAFAMQLGVISKLTNNKFSAKLGRYAYSVYIMQQTAFILLGLTFWQYSTFVNSYKNLTIAISLTLTVLLGIVVYHLVEIPALRLLRKLEHISDNKTV